MKTTAKNIAALIAVIAADILSVALGIAVWIVSGETVDDIVIPLGIFLLFTAAQTAAAILGRKKGDGAFAISVTLSVLKLVIVFCTEFFWDIRNIYFGDPDKTAISVLIISYLISIAVVFACELATQLLSKIRSNRMDTISSEISE